VVENKWRPKYKVFSHENGLKFSEKVGIFPKMVYFLVAALDAMRVKAPFFDDRVITIA